MSAFVEITIVDAKGDVTPVRIHFGGVNDLIDFGILVAGVDDIANMINALTTGGLRSISVGYEYDISGLGWSAVADLASDVQEKGEFVIRTVGGFLSRLNIPTFDEALFLAGSKDIDQTDPDVAAFITFLESGLLAAPDPSDYRGDDFAVVEAARENWGKRRL